jgi:trigger factor
MEVQLDAPGGLRRQMTVRIPADTVTKAVDDRLKRLSSRARIPGFRPGKAPMKVIRQQYGESARMEAVSELVQQSYPEALTQAGVNPAGMPKIDVTAEKPGEPLEYVAAFEVYPEIQLADLSQLKVERPVVEITEADVDRLIDNLRKARRSFAVAERPAATGDQVTIDFVGKLDGEPFEGGAAEDYPLTLGSGSFIPGFEEQLVGVTAGEEKAVTVNFPEDYQAAHLAGKQAVFDCTVKAVKAPVPAEINDDLAQKYGAESLDALKAQIAERLEQEYAGAARAILKRNVLDALDEMVSFDLPPTMVESEAKQIAHQLWHEDHPDVQGHDHEEIEPTEEQVTLAERRVRLGLLLADLGQKAEVQVSDAEMTQAVMTEARNYPGHEREFFEFVQKSPQMRQQLRAPIFEDKVIDYVVELAEITERPVSKEELEAAIEAMNEM